LNGPDLFAGTLSRERLFKYFPNCAYGYGTIRVLIYLLLADHRVEIVLTVASIHALGKSAWISICQNMERPIPHGQFESGVLLGITEITALLQQNFPAQDHNPNDLPNRPKLLYKPRQNIIILAV